MTGATAEPAPDYGAELLKTPEQRRAELRRMRVVATSLLGGMTVVFVATRLTHADWPWLGYLNAFAEAGMVGACADWFAVVALFRRPLGLPIPHTAVVPANKKRIGAALGRFIANNFLSPRVAATRLAEIDVVGFAARWIEDERNAETIAKWSARLAPRALDIAPTDKIADWVGMAARRGVDAIPAAPLASRALSALWAEGAAQELLDSGLDFVETTLIRNKTLIARKVKEQSSRWIPKWVDDMIASKVINGLIATIREMQAPNHPWRGEAAERIDRLIEALAHDPEMRARGEALKASMLDNPVFQQQAQALWGEVETSVRGDLPRHAETIAGVIVAALRAFGRWMTEDEHRRKHINRQIRLFALRAILPRRGEIGGYIARVVDDWDVETLVTRLELQVGKDLQFIRINGTLVGGLVGLLIYAASRAIGGT